MRKYAACSTLVTVAALLPGGVSFTARPFRLEIPAYAPVALAGLGWLPDTIMSRAVVIRMRRRSKEERVEPFRRRIHLPAADYVRSMIEAWARTAEFEIVAPDELPPEIQDRDADVWGVVDHDCRRRGRHMAGPGPGGGCCICCG